MPKEMPMRRSAFRPPLPFGPKGGPLASARGPQIPSDLALADQSSSESSMPEFGADVRALINAFDEPALVVKGVLVRVANVPARRLLGEGIEQRDLRLAIRHPQAL